MLGRSGLRAEGRRRHRAVSESAAARRRVCVDEKTAIQALDRWTRCCRCRPAAPSAMALSTTGTARSRCMPPSTPGPARHRPDGPAAHQCRLRRVPRSTSSPPNRADARSTSSSTTCRRTRRRTCRRFSAAHPARPLALHADLFVLAEPSRTLVRQDRARPARPRNLHVGARSGSEDSPLHHALQRRPETDPVDVQQSGASQYYRSAELDRGLRCFQLRISDCAPLAEQFDGRAIWAAVPAGSRNSRHEPGAGFDSSPGEPVAT